MNSIAAAFKVFFIIIWFFLISIIGIILSPGKWKSIHLLSLGAKLWSNGCGFIVRLKKHYYGEKPYIKGIVVSNHLSYMDIITTSSIFNIRFAPMKEISKWPVLGQFLGLSKPIWIDRNSRQSSKNTMKAFAETVKHDINLIVFPEGKISDCKNGLQPFKSTVFEASIIGNVPIIPVILHYHDENVCWTKWKMLKHVWYVLKKKRVDVDVHFFEPVLPNGLSRKELSQKVYNMMNEKYKCLYCKTEN